MPILRPFIAGGPVLTVHPRFLVMCSLNRCLMNPVALLRPKNSGDVWHIPWDLRLECPAPRAGTCLDMSRISVNWTNTRSLSLRPWITNICAYCHVLYRSLQLSFDRHNIVNVFEEEGYQVSFEIGHPSPPLRATGMFLSYRWRPHFDNLHEM